jgi:hypothetical protein
MDKKTKKYSLINKNEYIIKEMEKYEGNETEKEMKRIIEMIENENIIDDIDEKIITNENIREIDEKIVNNFVKNYEFIETIFNNLDKNEYCIIPCGYSNKNKEGHGIGCIIKKLKIKERYDVYIINSGEGYMYHKIKKYKNNPKNYYQKMIKII